jgi:uncharacterized peroxidase-related enzyme
MHLPSVENNPSAKGAYADLIAAVQSAGQPVPQIWHLFAYKPAMSAHLERLTQEIMRGPSQLSAGFRELIAALTSARNQTPFCATTHASATAELLGNRALVDSVIRDVSAAPVSDAERALLVFVEKVNRQFWAVGPADFDALHQAGWGDEATFDAIAVCALFNFYNRWVSANGVCQMPESSIDASGKRIAQTGYLRTDAAAAARK